MRISSFTQDEKLLEIKADRAPIAILIIMSIIAVLTAIIPILSIVYTGISGEGLHLGNFILLFVFGFIDFFLVRIILWNCYGRERFELKSESLEYYADYGWFKGEKRELLLDGLKFEIIFENESVGRLSISNGNEVIDSVLTLSIPDLNKIISEWKI